MSYTAFVPARSGSTRLPNKNIKPLNGKPLLVWTLEACVRSKNISEVIFSTDSLEYWDIARKYISSPKLVLDLRTIDDAGDDVKIFDYLRNNVEKIFENRDGQFLMALPTMPLRTTTDIDIAIQMANDTGAPIFSAVEYEFPVSFAFSVVQDSWKSLFDKSPMLTGNTRSQDQQTMYHPNGAIYIRSIKSLKDSALNTIYDGAKPYIMKRGRSVDIDYDIDFSIAEILMAHGE